MGMSWGLDGSWHPEDFTANLKMSILHGRLRGLEVFEDVADHLEGHRLIAPLVDPDDLRQRLRDIEFNPVSQFIDVRGESVWLPSTLIESSAMNVSVEGSLGLTPTSITRSVSPCETCAAARMMPSAKWKTTALETSSS